MTENECNVRERDQDRSEADWAAITTCNQFCAIGAYAEICRNDMQMWRDYARALRKRPSDRIDVDYVRHMAVNSWNTERLLELTRSNFRGEGVGFVTQWAFPQGYYSVFNSTLASFSCSGFSQKSHTAVRKLVAHQAAEGTLPRGLNVFADGGFRECRVHGMEARVDQYHSAVFDPADPDNWKSHIIAYLKSTRKMHLRDKREDVKINNALGFKKRRLTRADWERVSHCLGKTSWLCLLYRKRIKSNYRDIDTFLSPDFDTGRVLEGLLHFVWVFNYANEINVVNHLGCELVKSWVPGNEYRSLERIQNIATGVFEL